MKATTVTTTTVISIDVFSFSAQPMSVETGEPDTLYNKLNCYIWIIEVNTGFCKLIPIV